MKNKKSKTNFSILFVEEWNNRSALILYFRNFKNSYIHNLVSRESRGYRQFFSKCSEIITRWAK